MASPNGDVWHADMALYANVALYTDMTSYGGDIWKVTSTTER